MTDVWSDRLCCSSQPPTNNNTTTTTNHNNTSSWYVLSCGLGGLLVSYKGVDVLLYFYSNLLAFSDLLLDRSSRNCSSSDVPRRGIPPEFITEEDAPRTRESRQRRTRANMFEMRGIPFVLLDIACLVLGMYFNDLYWLFVVAATNVSRFVLWYNPTVWIFNDFSSSEGSGECTAARECHLLSYFYFNFYYCTTNQTICVCTLRYLYSFF